MDQDNIPEAGETVVCRVKQVLNYGAFVELVEYGNSKGFVHISQVSTRWVKNIRNFVKESQIRAAKVLSINRERNQIDLSFTKVSASAQRARIEEWKQLKRCKKMLEVLAKDQHKTFDQAWEAIAKPLLEAHGSLPEAFQAIALLGQEAAEHVEKSWLKPLLELVEKNIPVPEKTLKGVLSLQSLKPNGVEVVKEALAKAEATSKKVEVFYSGGGKFALKATGTDFKEAEKNLNNAAEAATEAMKESNGEAKFERSE